MRSSIAGWLIAVCTVGLPTGVARAADAERLFRETVLPAFDRHCYDCHSARAKKARGGRRLDTPAGLRAGGDSGPAVVPGDPAKSLIVQAVRHAGDVKMPPDKPKLPDDIIAAIGRWVEAGAPDPRGTEP